MEKRGGSVSSDIVDCVGLARGNVESSRWYAGPHQYLRPAATPSLNGSVTRLEPAMRALEPFQIRQLEQDESGFPFRRFSDRLTFQLRSGSTLAQSRPSLLRLRAPAFSAARPSWSSRSWPCLKQGKLKQAEPRASLWGIGLLVARDARDAAQDAAVARDARDA